MTRLTSDNTYVGTHAERLLNSGWRNGDVYLETDTSGLFIYALGAWYTLTGSGGTSQENLERSWMGL